MMRVPGWERFPWLRAGFSTREGGLSSVYGIHGVYGQGEQNLGWTREDDPQVVARNRERFVSAAAAGTPMELVTLQQVHGNLVRSMDNSMDNEAQPWRTAEGKALLEGDGLISAAPGRMVGVVTADCLPVLLADTRTHAVAALHAGWRGTLAGIAERGVAGLREHYGSRPEDLVAAIGPCIGPCCFEVGGEVYDGFSGVFPYAAELLRESVAVPAENENQASRWHLDLGEANRRQLLDAGLLPKNICSLAECTACTRLPNGRRKFYSYRAEQGVTGRMLSVIGVC